jgi:cation/acetate symporter
VRRRPRSRCREGPGRRAQDEAAAPRPGPRPRRADNAGQAAGRHAEPRADLAGDPNGDAAAKKAFDESRRNFLALIFCLMVGTAALPHILMRYYTTPSVKEAPQSVTWSLFFIFLLYFTAPALWRCW